MRSGGLLLRRALLDDAHDVGLLHDQKVLAVDAHLGARPLAEQDAVAGPNVELLNVAVLVASTGPDRDDLALLGLLLGGVRNDDAAFGLLLRIDAADHDTVVQGTKLHKLLQASVLNVKRKGQRGWRSCGSRPRRGRRYASPRRH